MRIDKYLKNSRLIKRRISVNGKVAKPGLEVKVGDEIFIQFGNGSLRVEVAALTESCRKEDAASMYKVIE